MILIDTGFWIALANVNDNYHSKANQILQTVNEPLVTTWPVLTETVYFFTKNRCPAAVEGLFLMLKKGAYSTFPLPDAYGPRISALLKKYEDLPMDLADASLVIVAEELDSGKILSTDVRDFQTYRWKQRQAFHNLLAE